MIRKTLVAAAWLALAAAAAPATAHAQFGDALKRAAKKKIEQKAADKVVDKAVGDEAAKPDVSEPSSGASSSGRERSAPTFDGRVLELKPEVVDRFLLALKAEGPAREAFAKDQANEGKYRATIDKYERCQQREMEKQQQEMEARQSDPKMMEWQLKYWRAAMSGDTVAIRVMTDSLITLGYKPNTVCGGRPVEAFNAINRIENAEREVEGTAADAGEFSVEQYSVMKERVIPWAAAKKQGKSLKAGFSKTEQDALEAKGDALVAALKHDLEANK
jgi:hypothetical protein